MAARAEIAPTYPVPRSEPRRHHIRVVVPVAYASSVKPPSTSVRALEDVKKDDKQILLVAQKNSGQDDPTPEDIHDVGTIGTVLQLMKLPDATVKVLVEGSKRARIISFADNEDFFQANASSLHEARRRDCQATDVPGDSKALMSPRPCLRVRATQGMTATVAAGASRTANFKRKRVAHFRK